MEYGKKLHRRATSIPIQPEKLRRVLYRNFLNLGEASRMLDKSSDYMSSVLFKKRMCYWTLDKLACELGMTTEDLFNEIVDEQEWLGL